MAVKKHPVDKNQKQEIPSKEKRKEAKIKMFIQMLDIKSDSNMTRFYSAFHSLKNT